MTKSSAAKGIGTKIAAARVLGLRMAGEHERNGRMDTDGERRRPSAWLILSGKGKRVHTKIRHSQIRLQVAPSCCQTYIMASFKQSQNYNGAGVVLRIVMACFGNMKIIMAHNKLTLCKIQWTHSLFAQWYKKCWRKRNARNFRFGFYPYSHTDILPLYTTYIIHFEGAYEWKFWQSVPGDFYQMYAIAYTTYISSANKYYKC